MKYIITCFTICIISINVLIWIKIDNRQKDLETETQIKLLQMSEKIEEQNKEIRLLKTDMEILQKGYERDTEN